MSYPHFGQFVLKRPWLKKIMLPWAERYCAKAGWRQLGLRADDLIPEENDTVLLALKRLPQKEAYDRVYRLRRAFQLQVQHQILPQTEWTTPQEDRAYLMPIIEDIEKANRERADLDNLTVSKKLKEH